MRSFVACCALMLALAIGSVAQADVKLAKIFGDHMVLQQGQENAIWGWAEPGEEVTITVSGVEKKVTTKAGDNGRWSTKLPALKPGDARTITVAGKNTIELKDVLVGEVWIASGQSNMEWSVNASGNPQQENAQADYPQIRMFNLTKNPAEKPQDDCGGQWDVAQPGKVGHFSAVGLYFARHLNKELKVPVGIIHTSWGGTVCEAWTSQEVLESDADFKPIVDRGATYKKDPNQAANLFDGMINPIIPYGIRGAIWYQGESNLGRAKQYQKLFPAMIGDWRKRFGQGDFPFLFVQLAPHTYGGKGGVCPELWDAQFKTLKGTPNTGMCVTTDIAGDIKDIHPKNKQDVGKRLALWALAKTYGQSDLVYTGPLYESMSVDGNRVKVKFTGVGGGLEAKGSKELSYFELAGEDQKWHPAIAIISGNEVVVESGDVAKPVAVRFAWSGIAEPNFFNKEGLPASPFRSDDWKLQTEGAK